MPLAIEMAAGRLRELTLTAITRQLDWRLTLLTGGPRGRHATARNVLAWSFETCSAPERALWARLSVFPGRFAADAAAEVCASGELSGPALLETIIALVNKSLLVRVDPPADGQPAFRMLDTVREYGAERLAASGEEQGIRDRFLARYLALARQADALVTGDNQVELFAGLRAEHASITEALSRSLEAAPYVRDRERDGGELASQLWAYWMSSGLLAEGLYWLGKALDRVTLSSPQRAWLHVARCLLGAVDGGSVAAAIADGRSAVELAERLKRPEIAARGYAALALACVFGGDLEAAHRTAAVAGPLLAAAGDTDGMIILDAHLALLYQASGEPERGISCYERGIGRFRADSGERLYHGYLHLSAAMCYLELPGREAECARVLSLALLAKYDLDEVTGTAYGLEMFGWLAAAAGRWERAAWLLGAAGALWDRFGARVSGAAHLERRHQDAATAARRGLGPDGYAAVYAAGRGHPLGQVVALAINDADTLDGPLPAADQPGAGSLTERELEVAYLAAAGLPGPQIAARLFLPPEAVGELLASVFGKLGVTSAAQLGPWLGDQLPPASGPH
jgi:predicted ATPase/DNA-binding CsgD family transcriptional regulator